ncbi:MAG: hypothetical protein K0Q55_2004, partial [Verrucomicrobia bacterium]|nr:hypothetical protein [Verrucomicrobiota bacterium]
MVMSGMIRMAVRFKTVFSLEPFLGGPGKL